MHSIPIARSIADVIKGPQRVQYFLADYVTPNTGPYIGVHKRNPDRLVLIHWSTKRRHWVAIHKGEVYVNRNFTRLVSTERMNNFNFFKIVM